ncbi:MAG: two pore domain potassium channel family protein [Rikenellaceae bacterium]|nr:two pore domain potassium channel family protein [Rikenellaceae bacterium]
MRSLPPIRSKLRNFSEILRVIAGTILLISFSWEILTATSHHFSATYLTIQLIVCLIFISDLLIRWRITSSHQSFLIPNLFFLLISIPYLNIIQWLHIIPHHDWAILIGIIPILRAFLALYLVLVWIIRKNRVKMLFWAYILTVVLFTYLSALVFYHYEYPVNDKLTGFGNAMWWAWMNVTTVGAEIFAVTSIGKIITVLLPILGMLFFPIFTSYILQEYKDSASDDA